MIRPAAVFTALLVAAALPACAGTEEPRDADAAGGAPGDTARGVVAVVGAEPLTRVVVQERDDSGRVVRSVAVDGPVADTLRRLRGVEVWIRGPGAGSAGRPGAGSGAGTGGPGVAVHAFRVRGLADVPAADGTLERDGETAVLVTVDGERLRFPDAPASLLSLVGRRVWIAARPGSPPRQWGVL